MATYTIRLGDLIGTGFPIWETVNPYPIFDETYRSTLNNMIEQHYYMQEIGTETPADFRRMLNQRMREIMPMYNAMYRSEINWDNNPLVTYHSVTHDEGTNGTDFTEGIRENIKGLETDYHYGFDTPMNATSVQNADHMSNADKNEYGRRADMNGHATGQKDTTEGSHENEVETTVEGVSIYDKIRQYRELVYNIDKMVIDELADLFMMVF